MQSTSDRTAFANGVHPDDHILGDIDARAVIVEYADFECPACAQAAPALRLVQQRFAPHVCLVFRHYPLAEIHPHAMAAAQAAEAAAAQGRFWPLHDLLFHHELHLGRERILHWARAAGVDMVRFERELDAGLYRDRIEAHVAQGKASRVMSIPAVFVSGELCDVSFGIRRLHDLVERLVSASAT